MSPGPTPTFFDDPAAFLAEAGQHLATDPVLNTILATVAERAAAEDAAGIAPDPAAPYRWWAVLRDGDDVVGVAMRTAPFAPFPVFVLPMPDAAAVALARALHDRGEPVGGVNGARPAADTCAAELAALTGGEVRGELHTRLHRLDRVVPPAPARGTLRPAAPDEVDLVVEWFAAFSAAADEQAGREPGSMHHMVATREGLQRRVADEEVWLWVDEAGTPVHLTARHPPAYGAARIAPVYTPPRAPRPRLRRQHRRGALAADPGRRRRAVPLHRPGQPDVQQALRRARLPAGRRHGRPAADRRRAARGRALDSTSDE